MKTRQSKDDFYHRVKTVSVQQQNIEPGGDELILCEGEFDCMVIWQCGFKNVVSVGAGANSLKTLLEQAKGFRQL